MSCFKAGHRVASKEFIDEEFAKDLLEKIEESQYTDKEAMATLDFLHKFNSEYHKNVLKKDDPTALHQTKKLRRDCYSRENGRNRDILSMRRDKVLTHEESIIQIETLSQHPEDWLIDILDGKMLYESPEEIEN